MNKLSKSLLVGLLEQENYITAFFGGGFKPPTKGHFEVVKQSLEQNPNIDKLYVVVGSGIRDGVSQDESYSIWNIYKKYLGDKVEVVKADSSPLKYVKDYIKANTEHKSVILIGSREGNDEDVNDFKKRKTFFEKYGNHVVVKDVVTAGGISGTKAREAANISKEQFFQYLPTQLTDEEKNLIFSYIQSVIQEKSQLSEKIEKDVINSFDIQDSLIKDVWDDLTLKPEIREKLLLIAQDFFNSLELPEGTILKDIKVTGSLANFNWSKFSDVDLHLVIDFSEISDNEKFAKDYFDAKKNLWNNAHDINIFGYPVEVYVEDVDEAHTSSGLYSVLNDEWITIPQSEKIVIDKSDIKSKAQGYFSSLPQLQKMYDNGEYEQVIETIDQILAKIKQMRSSGLEKGGQYSVENLAFKVLRRSDFIDGLKTLKTDSYDSMMSLKEAISKSQLSDVESYADKLFAKLGIDVEFTRHFLDRLNDKRNGKPISVAELMGIFKRLHRKHGKPLSKTDFDFEAVVKDLRNDLNIPFAINITPEDIDLVAKTIMRKKDFKTSTPVIAINENASYSKDIDYKKHILELTKHMLDKGMNIKPLPKVIFNDGDVENAREFLGRTAYYNPNNNTIVLYTEGRHPKDIVRSFAHEMIHHIQNLEGRLENISTTNTHEDDHLNDIEAEANLKGTMTFRNWTDTLTTSVSENNPEDGKAAPYGSGYNKLNEAKPYKHKHGFDDKLGKDPFGLNQFAREIAEETINEGRYDSCANKVTKIVFEKFKSFHDEGPNDGEFEQSVGSECADIIDDTFEFDLIGKVKFTDGEYSLDGGSNAGFDNFGEEITPLLVVKFKIPTNPDWQKIYFDIADVVRHELEHLTQDGENVKPGKKMNDDKFIRDLINADLLPKSQYFKLEKEVDAMLQGLYFKAKKSKQPLKKVIDEYLDIFVTKNEITSEDKEEILDIWRSRGKALSLPLFENKTMSEAENTNYVIYCDMDGVLVDFDKQFTKLSDGIAPRDYENQNGKDEFWNLIDNVGGVGFWVGMPWMPNGKQLWEYISPNTPTLLSSPSRSEKSRLGKRLWVRNNLPGTKLILANSYNKKNYAEENHILIDDRPSNIDQWRAAGGIGILFTSTNQTIQELKELGL